MHWVVCLLREKQPADYSLGETQTHTDRELAHNVIHKRAELVPNVSVRKGRKRWLVCVVS